MTVKAMEFRAGDAIVTVNAAGRAGLLAEIARRLQVGQGFALATLNLDHLVKLGRDPAFARAYAGQDLVTADGNPIVWLSRLAGRRVELITGSDLILPLMRVAAAEGVPVGLFGATEPALAAAAAGLTEKVPGLRIAITLAPPMGFDPAGPAADDAVRALQAAGARLVLVALGAPKQEIFAAHARALAPGIGFAGIGAGLDFIAGAQKRAPAWVRAIAMEWLWRMLSNPGRLARRYALCALILPGQALAALRLRGR